jgi:TolB protein
MTARTRLLALAASGLAVCGVTLAAEALATPPGKNGRIAFMRTAGDDGQNGAIFVMNADGKLAHRLTTPSGSGDIQPDWSRDGSLIVFQREYSDKPYEIWTVRPDGSEPTLVDPDCPPGLPPGDICEESSPAWSPDGRFIAFSWAYGKVRPVLGEDTIEVAAIGVMDADGGNVRQVTQRVRPTHSEDGEPVWSPDGKQIAFVRLNITARPRARTAIFVVNADGSGLKRLTPWSLNGKDHPDWSPDGREILFRSEPNGIDYQGNLYTVRPDGTGLRQLTHFGEDVMLLSTSFSPDGRSIVFSKSGKGGQPDIFTMRRDGTQIKPLTRTALWDSAPDWGPGGGS